MDNMLNSIKAYAMFATNTSFLKKSSSGGIFSLLAEDVIRKAGVVFGAAFCNNFKSVEHIPINSIDDLNKIQGSKYLKSDIGQAFIQVEKFLKKDTDVLFSGTPCQISALKKYLKKDYDNLLTVAVICHGTPNKIVWGDYITEKENKYKSQVASVNFRDKSKGWRKYRLCIRFSNGKQYCKSKDRDVYMCGFLQNITLEKRCFACHFKGNNIESDIILGDFWGVENVAPKLQNNCGTSLVIVRNEKGMSAVKKLLPYANCQEVDLRKAIVGNSSLFTSARKPENYDVFWRSYYEIRCSEFIKRFLQKKNYISLLKHKIGKNFVKSRRKI